MTVTSGGKQIGNQGKGSGFPVQLSSDRRRKDGREVVPRSEYEYPQEVRAEAVALALVHRSYAEAAREMARRYPE